MTNRIAATVMTSQMVAKQRAAHCRIIANLLRRARPIMGKSSWNFE